MEPDGHESSSPKSGLRTSLVIGVVFLFIMALFWAVDNAIVYIAAGCRMLLPVPQLSTASTIFFIGVAFFVNDWTIV